MRAGEASNASATFDGTLVITAPSGKQLEVRTTFDTGSDTDAVIRPRHRQQALRG